MHDQWRVCYNGCQLTGWLGFVGTGPSGSQLPELNGQAPLKTLAPQGSSGLLRSWPSRNASRPTAAFMPAPALPEAPSAGLSAGATTLRPSAATLAGMPLRKPSRSS